MNTREIKKNFAIFDAHPNLIYLDSAATSLTPRTVIDHDSSYYKNYDANIARGTYDTSAQATQLYEKSRQMMSDFLSAKVDEIIFTSGTTASINMIAHGLSHIFQPGDVVITTKAEHHANFVPWQMLAKERSATFTTVDITNDGHIDHKDLFNAIDHRTKIIALTHVSNVLGTVNPIKELIAQIRKINNDILIIVDAAQSAAHMPINVKELDCDFLAFSVHKIFGPTGVGVLYGKKEKLEKLTPLFTGGEMITEVSSTCTSFADLPHRLEAGTPNIAGVIATAQAIKFIDMVGFDIIHTREKDLTQYCIDKMKTSFTEDLTIYGPKDIKKRSSIVSFTFKNYHPHDIASILDEKKSIAIRAGQHCAMPLHTEHLGVNATARISLSIYNTKEDIDQLIDGLKLVDKILKK